MNKITLIGIDTAKSVFHMVGIDQHGKYVWRKQVTRRKFVSTLAQLEPCKVVLEACGASHHWARQIEACGHDARLIAPQHVKPYRRGQKNDYRDAEAVVSASLSPGIHFVGIKTTGQQAEQALHRVRSRLLSHRNAAANELRGLLGEYGCVFALGHKALRTGAVAFIDTEQAQALGLVELVTDVLEEMVYLEQRLQHYEYQIEQRVKADARDFGNGRNFGAYLGLAPGHRGTGGNVKIGKIRRNHDRYLRQLLIHGARSALRHLGDKQDAQSCWLRVLVERRGFNVACVALAHKNARQAWAILAREQVA